MSEAIAGGRRLRVLALVHASLVPPDELGQVELAVAPWKTEYDVVRTLRELGHEVRVLGVGANLADVRASLTEFQPHITFNLLEGYDDVATWDQNVVAYLELLRAPYTGCNSRGLLLARDKAIAKKLLAYHRIPVADFAVFARGRRPRRPRRLSFPLIVKSLTLDASIGISQASVVESDEKLVERVRFVHESLGTDALVERYVEGRELYVGVLGNERLQVLPVWELYFDNMPVDRRRIATERLKWSVDYQRRMGIASGEARPLPEAVVRQIGPLCKRVYRNLMLSGYARIDLRLDEAGHVWVIEANPNPQLSQDEDFARSAQKGGLEYGALIQRLLNLGLRWEPSQVG